ncbi:MAG TPA: RraA family protein [Pirellulales bacterium]|nr:RraA family protein [Pirellulales bacterium]
MMSISAATLAALAKFDTPTISNTIELFDVVPRNRGYMDGRIRAAFPELPPMVGFAATASFRSDAPPATGDAYGSIDLQVARFAELLGPAAVVFQDFDDPAVGATFGEVMCSTYRAFGSAGLITSGAGRDLEQVRALNYPVFTGGTICSHGYCHILHLGLPVRVGGLMVNNGDLLHGDLNGVTRIPLEIADQLPQAAAEFAAAEKIVLDYVRSPGSKTVAEFTARRKEFSAQVAQLMDRVQRKR